MSTMSFSFSMRKDGRTDREIRRS